MEFRRSTLSGCYEQDINQESQFLSGSEKCPEPKFERTAKTQCRAVDRQQSAREEDAGSNAEDRDQSTR
ncbi:MAG: hypothetical protein GY861_09710 [bacterium]|nr:hypothetical protein [bacterium]